MPSDRPRIKMFCIDFNSDDIGQAASPGLFAQADPRRHVEWCSDIGANAIQTFCVSLNGYAWYRGSKVAPVTPGMTSDYLPEVTELAHARGMAVHGYFCLGGNAWYCARHWERSSRWNIGASKADRRKTALLSTHYLDYFCRQAEDAVRQNPIEGAIIDWFDQIEPTWAVEAEREMYGELMGKPFPSHGIVPEAEVLEFRRRAIDRAWRRVREAIKSVRPEFQIWLNVPLQAPAEPLWVDSPAIREADMMLTERCDLRIADWLREQMGPDKPVIVCLGGIGGDHAVSQGITWQDVIDSGYDIYDYCKPDPVDVLPEIKPGSIKAEHVLPAFRETPTQPLLPVADKT